MTVATSPSTSPRCTHFIVQAASSILTTVKPQVDTDVEDINNDNSNLSNSNDDGRHHAQPVSQHPLTELGSRQLVDKLLEEAERRALMELVAAATNGEDAESAPAQVGSQNPTSTNPLGREPARAGEPDDEVVYGWEKTSGLVVRKTGGVGTRSTGVGSVRRKAASGLRSNVSMPSSTVDVFARLCGTNSTAASHGGVVRCVSEDYIPGAHSHRRAAWKSNVEPGTYRYIVNNGIYRSTKFASLGGDWVTAKRSRGGPGATVSSSGDNHTQNQSRTSSNSSSCVAAPRNSEIRQKQNMIRRDLNRYSFLNHAAGAPGNKRLHFEHSTIKAGDQTCGLTPSPANPAGHQQKDTTGQTDKAPSSQQQHNNKGTQHQQLQQQSSQTLLPPWSSSSSCYSRPDTRDPQLVKSASDLFVENFSSKIDALEKDDPTAGTPDCLPRPGTNPAVAMNSLQVNSTTATTRRSGQKLAQHLLYPHDSAGNQLPPGSSSSSVSIKSPALLQDDDISRDVFTVRPAVGIRASDQMPLKPLEKLTPQMQKKALKGKCSESSTSECQGDGGEGRSGLTSPASHDHSMPGTCANNKSNRSTPLGSGNVSPPQLSTSFMTAMNAFSQIHHHYHLAYDGDRKKNAQNSTHQSKSSPPTFRSNYSTSSRDSNKGSKPGYRNGLYNSSSGSGSGMKYSQHHETPSDVDSLNSVKNALTMTNSDIEKMRMNHLAVRDYNSYISTRPKPQLTGLVSGKPPPGNNKKASGSSGTTHLAIGNAKTLGLRPFNTTSAPLVNRQMGSIGGGGTMGMTISGVGGGGGGGGGDELSGVQSDSDTDSFLAGTSLMASRGGRERGMSLPEISGKRLSVTTSNHRML